MFLAGTPAATAMLDPQSFDLSNILSDFEEQHWRWLLQEAAASVPSPICLRRKPAGEGAFVGQHANEAFTQ